MKLENLLLGLVLFLPFYALSQDNKKLSFEEIKIPGNPLDSIESNSKTISYRLEIKNVTISIRFEIQKVDQSIDNLEKLEIHNSEVYASGDIETLKRENTQTKNLESLVVVTKDYYSKSEKIYILALDNRAYIFEYTVYGRNIDGVFQEYYPTFINYIDEVEFE